MIMMKFEKLAQLIYLDRIIEFVAGIQRGHISQDQMGRLEQEQGLTDEEYVNFLEFQTRVARYDEDEPPAELN